MSNSSNSVVCQRCGRGFMVTINYKDFLSRRGMQVKLPVICMTCFLNSGPAPKQQGRVKWFNPKKGYGFIIDREGQEVFLHQKQVLNAQSDQLQEGQEVQFHVHYATKGPEGWNIEVV